MRAAIVTTTINVPTAVEAYMANAVKYGHTDTLFVVTGDLKTPAEAKAFVIESGEKHNVATVYMDVDEQTEYLARFPELRDHLPWNIIQRRNVSILYAYEQNVDVIITIDDDNFCDPDTDYIGLHLMNFSTEERSGLQMVSSTTKWHNVCEMLEDKNGVPFYHRGFPMEQRWAQRVTELSPSAPANTIVKVNAGLWLGDPDIDACARLANDIDVVSYRYENQPNIALARQTWCPFNSQNTAIHRDVIPAYILSPNTGRMDDIWASYVVLRLMDHFGHSVAYGHPIVRQERNPHNYFRDHEKEAQGLELGQHFTDLLRAVPLTATTYKDGMAEISTQLRTAVESMEKAEDKQFIINLCDSLDVWKATMERLSSGTA
jgi:hypothetical protein